MATATKNPAAESAEKAAELNEKVLETSRRLGAAYIDGYERAGLGLADLQVKAAEATRVDWIQSVAGAQADFTRELTRAYANAARELVK